MPYVNDTGAASVTEVLKPWISSDWFLPEHSERGSAVHSACCAHLQGLYVLPLPDEWAGYLDSFRRWCDLMKPVPVLVEKRLVDEALGLSGQPDFIGRVQGRTGIGVIDLKTSAAAQKWWPLQGAGYRHLARQNGVITEWGFDLRLRADGSRAIATRSDQWPDDYRADLNRLLGAINLHYYFNPREVRLAMPQ